MTLTGSGSTLAFSAATLAAIGIVAGYPELIALGLCAAALIATAAAWVAAGGRVRATRSVRPDRIPDGGSASCELVATNVSRYPSADLELTEVVNGERLRFQLGSLPGRATSWIHTYRLPAQRRGVYRLPPPRLSRLDPARLMRRGFTSSGSAIFYVHPRFHWLAAFGATGLRDIDGQASVPREGGVAFYSLRAYVTGDDRRLIHWPSTARAGELMVRHNVMPDAPGYLVVLDTTRAAYTIESFEDAVRAAASLCVAAINAGAELRLRTTDHRVMPEPAADAPSAVIAVLDFLAGVSTVDDGVSWPQALTLDEDMAALVVVGGRTDEKTRMAVVGAADGSAAVAMVQIDQRSPGLRTTAGVVTVTARNSAEFADYWNRRPGR
jgi:uncharacterized protein (DUF58 family)